MTEKKKKKPVIQQKTRTFFFKTQKVKRMYRKRQSVAVSHRTSEGFQRTTTETRSATSGGRQSDSFSRNSYPRGHTKSGFGCQKYEKVCFKSHNNDQVVIEVTARLETYLLHFLLKLPIFMDIKCRHMQTYIKQNYL